MSQITWLTTFQKYKNGEVDMSILVRSGAAIVALGWAALGQTQQPPAASPTIERNPGCGASCATLVNKDVGARVVVTLQSSPDFELPMYDSQGNSAPLRPRTYPVLLQAGERRPVSEMILFEVRQAGLPLIRRFASLRYSIVGAYVPRPDLSDLPAGVATDYARLYERLNLDLAGTDTCRLGPDPREPRTLWVRNMNLYRNLAVSYRNARPGLNNKPQAVYLAPGDEAPIGCTYDVDQGHLTISEVRFAS
jgi:hypothetical protein